MIRGLVVLAVVLGACGGAGSGAYGGTANTSGAPAYPAAAATEPPKDYGYGYGPGPVATTAVTGELKIVENLKLGKILAGSNGLTLYTLTADRANTSTCYDTCASTWAPYTISGDPFAPAGLTGKLGTAARKDSSRQVTYNSLPVYTYGGDHAAGDANGHGLESYGGKWLAITNP